MISNTDGTERLYLSKGDKPIYIENCKIPQHHIDGLRFLYKHYKKKSGVIINYTSGYGRNLQVVLFLKALRHLFTQPVLILCQEGAEHDWMEHFQTWTDLCDDVVLETDNPFIKKQVFINTMSNLQSFSRRDWSVLVVDGDHSTKQILGLPFKADYRIWITSINMREDLDKFSLIYKWFYPKEKFDKAQFTPDKDNPADVVDKAILLDAFMEDIVARRDEEDFVEDNQEEESPPIRISRKNKDATGTKIKRSKRRILNDEDDIPLSHTRTDRNNIPNKTNDRNNRKEITLSALQTNEIDDFSVDNFKRKSIEDFDEDLLGEKDDNEIKMNSINSQSEVDLYYEPDSSTEVNSDRLYEMDTIVFGNSCDQSPNGNEIRDIIDQEQDRIKENNLRDDNDTPELDFDTKDVIPSKIFRNTNIESPVHESKFELEENRASDNESPSIFDIKADEEEIETKHEISEESLTDCEDPDNESETNRESPSICTDIKLNINEIETNKESLSFCEETKIDTDEIRTRSPICDDLKNEISEIKINRESDSDDEIESNIETINSSNEVYIKSSDKVIEDKNDVVTNALKRNCVEENIEDKVLKKFKGSILDSLF